MLTGNRLTFTKKSLFYGTLVNVSAVHASQWVARRFAPALENSIASHAIEFWSG